MNAIQSLFQKYNAVPADDAGPQYDIAQDEPLIQHAAALVRAWDTSPDTHGVILPELKDIRNALKARMLARGKVKQPGLTGDGLRLILAHVAVCGRIGA